MQLGGLHHVTAVTGHAAQNVDFYTRVLGLRLVKKTVNQDDVSAYHLFYGDEVGSPGTEITFFDWPESGPHRPGTGDISTIALRVPGEAALAFWAQRLNDKDVRNSGVQEVGGRATVDLADPEGQRLALVDDGGAPGGAPWSGSPVPAEHGIRGMDHVRLTVDRLDPTALMLTEVLGFRLVGEIPVTTDPARRVFVYTVGPGGPGAEVYVDVWPAGGPTRVGIGGVHHVAFRAPNDEEHRAWRERIVGYHVGISPIIDRYYFRSIYFREPGGILFEIATGGPGFATDEDPAHLGERLALPPFLEPRRAAIEAGLKPIEA
jgi:glyoxalase family protein